ncbi:MAG: thioredoxin family protein [Planctomycetes bacterium]|nr:thioredoxin family protein [Planctomycetota bacterium]
MFRCFASILVLLFSTTLQAGEFNKKLKVGDPAPAWKDLPGTDGKTHSLADLKGKEVVVVVFTCNSCPIAEDYEDRIVAFAKKHSADDSKVTLVAINVNTVPEDRLDKMKARSNKKKFTFTYLYDETQKIAKDFGATYTPEFFVLDKDRKIAYMGAMDDKSNEKEAKVNFLEPAVEAALKGEKAAKAETLARGCMIRFKKERD